MAPIEVSDKVRTLPVRGGEVIGRHEALPQEGLLSERWSRSQTGRSEEVLP